MKDYGKETGNWQDEILEWKRNKETKWRKSNCKKEKKKKKAVRERIEASHPTSKRKGPLTLNQNKSEWAVDVVAHSYHLLKTGLKSLELRTWSP